MLEALGAVVVDADVLAREALATGSPGAAEVCERFPGVLDRDGGIDRSQLAALVFADASARFELEQIVHPEVRRRALEILEDHRESDRVVVEVIPLLFESGRTGFDLVVVTDCEPEIAIRRAVARGMSEPDARARQAAQLGRADRLSQADVVIDTSGSLDDVRRSVDAVWQQLCNDAR